MPKIGIFVAVCERDMNWTDQFIREARRVGYPVAWYADHLSPESLKKISEYSVFVHDEQVEQFTEKSKSIPYKFLKTNGFDWAIQQDIDETFELDFREKLEKSAFENPSVQILRCPMITVYDDGIKSQRIDDVFGAGGNESGRDRVYNLKYNWAWMDPITNGAKYQCKDEPIIVDTPAATVHWGYATKEMRTEHAKKWKDILFKIWGRNPYKKWEQFEQDTLTPHLIPLKAEYYKHLC